MTNVRLIGKDPRPRTVTFIDYVDEDGNRSGEALARAPQYPIMSMTCLGNWKWDEQEQRAARLRGVRQTPRRWRFLIEGFIDSDEQAYLLSIGD